MTLRALTQISPLARRAWTTALPFSVVAPLYLALMFALPALPIAAAFTLAGSKLLQTLILAVAPIFFAVAYGIVAGVLSIPFRGAMVRGKLARDLKDPTYAGRRIYGLCWTAVYYFKPVFHLFLCVPLLKKVLFRLFGYRGALDFTTYPDTWIRDLPLLQLGSGAYLSNRATIGTNIVFPNGKILVDQITVGDGALVGHLCLLAPGSSLGRGAEIGVGTALGIRTRLDDGAKVGPRSTIEHYARIGAGTTVGIASFVGAGSKIGPNLVLPPGSFIPARTVLKTQDDVERCTRRGPQWDSPAAMQSESLDMVRMERLAG